MSQGRRERERGRERVSARRRLADHRSGFQSSLFRMPEGYSFFQIKEACVKRLDFLCYPVGKGNPFADAGMLHYERTFFSHAGIGADNRSYVCPARTTGGKCPICEFRIKGAKARDLDDRTVKSLLPKERQLWILYDLGDLERGVQIWETSHHTFGKKLDSLINSADPEDGYEYFADPEDGMTVRASFDMKSAEGFTFFEATSVELKRRSQAYTEEFCRSLPCLDDLLIIPTYDKLRSLFLQVEENGEEDDVSAVPEDTRASRRVTSVALDRHREDELEELKERDTSTKKQRRESSLQAPWDRDEADEEEAIDVASKLATKRKARLEPGEEEEQEKKDEGKAPPRKGPSKMRLGSHRKSDEVREEDGQHNEDEDEEEWWED